MTGSSGAICELSRSKKRYHDQDLLLNAFINHGGYTAKEVAVEVLDWRYEPYANSPKRAFDLFRLGYLEQLDSRECRQTRKAAHTYRITDKGLSHLRKTHGKSFVEPSASVMPEVKKESISAKQRFGDLKSILGD